MSSNPSQEGLDLIKELSSWNARHLLITTFNIDLSFLECAVLPHLEKAKNPSRLTVLIDRRQYLESARLRRFVHRADAGYRLIPVTVPNGSFHPKIHAALGAEGINISVGSANLTDTGFRKNLELVDVLRIGPSGAQAAAMLRAFLLGLIENNLVSVRGVLVLKELVDMIPTEPANEGDWEADSSISGSLFSKLPGYCGKKVERFTIVSPYHDPHNRPLIELARLYPQARFRLILPKGNASVNPEMPDALKKRVEYARFKNKSTAARYLHAKLILAESPKDACLISGSANFTKPGSMLDWKEGNIEAWTVQRGSIARFRPLFSDSFALEKVSHPGNYIWPDKDDPSEAAASLDWAVYEHQSGLLRIGVRSWTTTAKTQVKVKLHGVLGAAEFDGKVDGAQREVAFLVPASATRLLRKASTVSLSYPVGSGFMRTAPIWIELPAQLELDPAVRQVWESLEEFGDEVADGKLRSHQAIRHILSAVYHFVSAESSESASGGVTSDANNSGAEKPGGGNGGLGLSDRIYPSMPGEARGSGGILAQISAHIERFLESGNKPKKTLPRVPINSPEGRPEPGEEDKDRPATPPEEIDLKELFRDEFSGVLDCFYDLDAGRPGGLRRGLDALDCLTKISFALNMAAPESGDHDPQTMEAGFASVESDWHRAMRAIFEPRSDTHDGLPGWLNGAKPAGPATTDLKKHPFVVGCVLFLAKWRAEAERDSKGRPSRYRDRLACLERMLGLDAEEWKILVGEAVLLAERFNSRLPVFPSGPDLEAQLDGLYRTSDEGTIIRATWKVVEDLIEAEKSNATPGRLVELRGLIPPHLKGFQAAFDRLMPALRKGRTVLYFIDPKSQTSCPGCRSHLPAGARLPLEDPMQWKLCPNCESTLLVGALRFMSTEAR